jgi:hypothetical protein
MLDSQGEGNRGKSVNCKIFRAWPAREVGFLPQEQRIQEIRLYEDVNYYSYI